MRIGICALGAISQDTGGQTYIINLARTLQEIDRENEFYFFVSDAEGDILPLKEQNFKKISVPNTSANVFRRLAGEHIKLPSLITKYKIDIMYYPNNFASFYCPVPYAVAIRSMLYYHYPYAIDKTRLRYRKWLTPRSARRAKKIIAPSEDIKKDICNYIKTDPAKVKVIHHGVNTSLFEKEYDEREYAEVFNSLGINAPFFLYVSALWEYKNQDKLILAFKDLVKRYNIPHQLILVGKGLSTKDSYEQRLRNMIKDLKLEKRVIMPGFLGHDKLKYLYKKCEIFVFPSSYESFGNPLFEAMSAGVPIVASNVHSFPEMIKDAGLLVDPLNVDELAGAISKILQDPSLKRQLIQAGKERVNFFSWIKCVTETLSVLQSTTRQFTEVAK
ncbi:glycosyltransferase family 4 protein [bacterium]|nr:MAG: glycosyltransferase family 4 protein [bacterium]